MQEKHEKNVILLSEIDLYLSFLAKLPLPSISTLVTYASTTVPAKAYDICEPESGA